MTEQRLQKILSSAGYGSRRKSEDLIRAGRVKVNGEIAILGTRADPEKDDIHLDGALIPTSLQDAVRRIALHKPVGLVVTHSDELGRPTIFDLLKGVPEKLKYAGRLDKDTSGLLILSTDGNFNEYLTHPRFEIEKEYVATLTEKLPRPSISKLLAGVQLDDGSARANLVEQDASEGICRIRIIIHEGRNRIVRRMLESVGGVVLGLHRSRIGPIDLADLAEGQFRDLLPNEVLAVQDIAKEWTPRGA